jgi:hypothetical protein
MPPRWATVTIIGFWLIAMAWMTVREIVPRLRVGGPPPYVIDLTDEVSGNDVNWTVLGAGAVGPGGERSKATSSVQRMPDRTFKLKSRLSNVNIPPFNNVDLKSSYHVDSQRSLLGFEMEGDVELPALGKVHTEVSGKVENGLLTPEVRIQGYVLRGEPAEVPGGILNSLHLLNRISGLEEGQSWSVPLIDPMQFFKVAPVRGTPRLDAAVRAVSLDWDGKAVPCLLIEYREPGKDKVSAQTWVRRSDGLVLQHAAKHGGTELILRRDPVR